MMKFIVSACLAAMANADCDGSPCQLLSVATPSRLAEPETEADPVLTVNTFTAVDKCATSEVRDLTGWVLSYYEDVSNQLDVSFSNILTTARLANSALRYLGALSGELQAFMRMNNISTEMNAMLRTCLADAMHLSASMEKCDMSFAQDHVGMESVMMAPAEPNNPRDTSSLWIQPLSVSANATCLSALCEHFMAWNDTCGDRGFASDLTRIAAAHDLEGSQYSFAASRESPYHQPPTNLYTEKDDAANFAILNEDLFTQEAALLNRVKLWLDVQFHGMMVMVRRALNGGQLAQASDLDICEKLGFPMDHVSWLSLAFEKCEGSMVTTWLKVNPMNKAFMHELVQTLADKIPNVFHPGVNGKPGKLFGGMLSNYCTKFQDNGDAIVAEMGRLQRQHQAMSETGASMNPNNFYLEKPGAAGSNEDFPGENSQQWYMSKAFMTSPFGAAEQQQ